jgi:phosphoadenosine phosphosulfate reductase
MRVNQLLPSIRAEVEKPFQEKLEKARHLIKLYANRNACVSCSFGKDSMVVLYLAREVNPSIPVIFNNTGVEYPETLTFKEQLKQEWNLNLIETKPEISFWQVLEKIRTRKEILDDGRKHSNQCCYALKHKPFRNIIRQYGFSYTFTGITVLESRHRMFTACEKGMEYYSRKDGITKIHPILYWTPEEVWRFIEENSIPVNPAYQKYKIDRIGCIPCTSHKGWREQLAKVNPKMYQLVQERFFGQKLLEVE